MLEVEVRRLATCLKWEVGAITSNKAQGPLNIKGLALAEIKEKSEPDSIAQEGRV